MESPEKMYTPLTTNVPVERKFPKIVYLIVMTEICERFSFSGMKCFLALYLKSKLNFSDDGATEIYHIFCTIAYFFPIFGAILADGYLGKYRTILYMMFVYALGNLFVSGAAIPFHLTWLDPKVITLLGLLLIAMGTGGIKPCAASFGGDQFHLPDQSKQLATFFVYYYFAICVGSLAAKAISPFLKTNVQCFGDKECYSLGFGAPGILMLISVVVFVAAKRYYLIKKPSGNVLIKIFNCITYSIKNKISGSTINSHWLDSSAHLYGGEFIADLKTALDIVKTLLPIPFFYALLDQLGSRWTLQAAKMDGHFGIITIHPDQIAVVNPIIIIIAIPLLQHVLFPCMARVNLHMDSSHRLIAGFFLSSLSFIIAGTVELSLQKSEPLMPSHGTGQLRIFNTYNCDLLFMGQDGNFTISPLDFHPVYLNDILKEREMTFDVTDDCSNLNYSYSLLVKENSAISHVFGGYDRPFLQQTYTDSIAKSKSGFPHVRILTDFGGLDRNITLFNNGRNETEVTLNSVPVSKIYETFDSTYTLYVDGIKLASELRLKVGGVYTLAIATNRSNETNARLMIVTEPNSMSMAWLLPQLFLISIAEVFGSITGQEFAFKEAPVSMKALMQAGWLMMEAFGNVIIIIGTRLATNYDQATQSFTYASMTLVAMIAFYFLAKSFERRLKEKQDRRLEKHTDILLDRHNGHLN